MLAPTLVAVGIAYVFPIFQVLRWSLFDVDIGGGSDAFRGLDNYRAIFGSDEFWNAASVTLRYAGGVLFGTLVTGLAIASLLNQPLRGRGIARTLFLIPYAMPLVVIALIWRWMFDAQFGVINYGLVGTGVFDARVPWFSQPSTALPAMIAIQVWRMAPIATVLYLAGMQNIPHELKEAARIDGASSWQVFWHVTLPGLRGVTASLVLLLGVYLFGRTFEVILLITGGGPIGSTENLALQAYLRAFQFLDFGSASALSSIILAVTLILALAYLRIAPKAAAT